MCQRVSGTTLLVLLLKLLGGVIADSASSGEPNEVAGDRGCGDAKLADRRQHHLIIHLCILAMLRYSWLRFACLIGLAISIRGDFGAKDEILAKGLKAVNKWLDNNDMGCGWEDGTFMIGEHPQMASSSDSSDRRCQQHAAAACSNGLHM